MSFVRSPAFAGIAAVLSLAATTAADAQCGRASWYGPGFNGRSTANGERFNQGGFTAAHKSLPFGTRLRITNKTNGRSVIVRVNDRGPYVGGRFLDLSKGAATKIGLVKSGTSAVCAEKL